MALNPSTQFPKLSNPKLSLKHIKQNKDPIEKPHLPATKMPVPCKPLRQRDAYANPTKPHLGVRIKGTLGDIDPLNREPEVGFRRGTL